MQCPAFEVKTMRRRFLFLFSLLLVRFLCRAQTTVHVDVDLAKSAGKFTPIYSWFGYDESGYTVTENGQALLAQLHDLSPVPVYIRAHFLLTSGDGKPDLKWSSSNVYTEDANGNPIYSWTILDKIFDAYAGRACASHGGAGLYAESTFHPSRSVSHRVAAEARRGRGMVVSSKRLSSVGRNYRQVAAHMVKRYGKETVSTWYWEVWNEPDGKYYWKGTQEEYNKLYDYAVTGVRQAIPHARVGGPATTGPGPAEQSL